MFRAGVCCCDPNPEDKGAADGRQRADRYRGNQATQSPVFRAADEKDWHTLRGLFTDDARAWYPGPARWFTGADEIVAWASGFLGPGTITVHHGFMPEITTLTTDRAQGIWAMRDDVDILEREGSGRRRFVGAGHYREEYRRVGGQWKIQQLVLTRLRVDEVTVRFGGPPPAGVAVSRT